ncbi:TPA: glycosyltransferase family 4 protein, partial [Vibrio cholerae]
LHLPYSNRDPYFKRILKFAQFSFHSTLKVLKIKADVVLATSTPLTIAIPGVICSKYHRIPLVFEVRDLWPELPIAIGALKNPILIKMAQFLEKFAYRNSTRLVGLSPGMCAGIEKHGIPPEKITLATNSCDTDLFDVSENIGLAYKESKLPFVGKKKLVVYTGTFGPINDVAYIVHLAKASLDQSLNTCFVAIGAGMQKSDVVKLALDLGVLNKNLFILDPVAKTEIVELLSAADLSISLFGPIKEMWNNSANKLFDALASGTPIAINYGGWQKEFIEERSCGLVLDNNYLQSAMKIDSFLNDEVRCALAKVACNDLAYNYYSRDIMADRLESALLEAVNVKKEI